MSTTLQIAMVVVALLSGMINLVRRQWMVNIIALALQYVAIFVLVLTLRPVTLAIIKPLIGLMVTLVIYLTLRGYGKPQPIGLSLALSAGELFRELAGILLLLIVYLFIPMLQLEVFQNTSQPILMASFGLVVLALIQLGTKTEPLYVVIALLTFMTGFELLYASLELSTLLEALFAGVNLGLGVAGSYFIVKDIEEMA